LGVQDGDPDPGILKPGDFWYDKTTEELHYADNDPAIQRLVTVAVIEAYATQAWVNANFLALTGGTMAGSIDMDGNLLGGLPAPSSATEAARLSEITDLETWINNTFMPLAGGNFSGDISLTNHDIVGVKQIQYNQDGPIYGINLISSTNQIQLALAGGSNPGTYLNLNGPAGILEIYKPLDMRTNRIKNLADPTSAQDATTRAWVQAQGYVTGGPYLPLVGSVWEAGNKNIQNLTLILFSNPATAGITNVHHIQAAATSSLLLSCSSGAAIEIFNTHTKYSQGLHEFWTGTGTGATKIFEILAATAGFYKPLSMNSNKITNLAAPTNANDAARLTDVLRNTNYDSLETQQTTTSATMVQAHRFTSPVLQAGVSYLINYCYTIGNQTADKDTAAQVQINDTTTICNDLERTKDSNHKQPRAGFYKYDSTAAASINIDFDFSAPGGGTATIEDMRITIEKVNN